MAQMDENGIRRGASHVHVATGKWARVKFSTYLIFSLHSVAHPRLSMLCKIKHAVQLAPLQFAHDGARRYASQVQVKSLETL